jgi:hypothetical protein
MSYSSSRASLLLSTLGLVVGLLLGNGCTEDVGTSIRISLVYKDGWRMGDADVILSQADNTKLERSAKISHELLVLVPDSLAGNVMPLEVWGVREGERIAHGSAVALVRKGETVEATIVLDRLPCGVFCEPGEVECEGGGVATCEEDADGCLQWSTPQMCPGDQPFCSGGVCGTVCADDCVAGQGTCTDATTQRACGEFDNDTCRDYGPSVKCTGAEVCYSGRCALPCAHATTLTNNAVPGATTAFAPAIVADRLNTLHAVYSVGTSRQLRYASKPRGGSWSAWTDVVNAGGTGALGENPSLVTDRAGGVHVVAGGDAVVYAYRAAGGGPWEVTTVESDPAPIGQSSSIAVTDDGNVHVVYYRSKDATLRHGRKGAPWALEDIKASIGQRCDLTVTGNTLHAVSFDAANDVWYSSQAAGGAWESAVIKTMSDSGFTAASGVSIVAGRDGTLHVAYSDFVVGDEDLRYLYRPAGGSWTTSTIIDNSTTAIGGFPELSIDPFDRLHVAYRTTGVTPTLRYATKPSGTTTWGLTPQPPSTPGVAPSIAVDPLGNVHILSALTPAGVVTETTRACQ